MKNFAIKATPARKKKLKLAARKRKKQPCKKKLAVKTPNTDF